MKRAVIFDFGNVICSFDLQQFIRRISPHSTRPLSGLLQLIPSFTEIAREYETGLMSSNEFFGEVCRRADLAISRDEFIKAYCEIFTPIQSTFDLIRSLKHRYRLGLMSNTNEWHYLYGIRPVAVFPLFDAVTLSFEVKAMKPARPMYDDILTKLAMRPGECAFVDDLQENVDAARSLGIDAILYTDAEHLLTSLRRVGITC